MYISNNIVDYKTTLHYLSDVIALNVYGANLSKLNPNAVKHYIVSCDDILYWLLSRMSTKKSLSRTLAIFQDHAISYIY